MTLPGARVINIRQNPLQATVYLDYIGTPGDFTSQEWYLTAHMASKFYHPAFPCLGSTPETYFNFSLDTCYIRYETFMYLCDYD